MSANQSREDATPRPFQWLDFNISKSSSERSPNANPARSLSAMVILQSSDGETAIGVSAAEVRVDWRLTTTDELDVENPPIRELSRKFTEVKKFFKLLWFELYDDFFSHLFESDMDIERIAEKPWLISMKVVLKNTCTASLIIDLLASMLSNAEIRTRVVSPHPEHRPLQLHDVEMTIGCSASSTHSTPKIDCSLDEHGGQNWLRGLDLAAYHFGTFKCSMKKAALSFLLCDSLAGLGGIPAHLLFLAFARDWNRVLRDSIAEDDFDDLVEGVFQKVDYVDAISICKGKIRVDMEFPKVKWIDALLDPPAESLNLSGLQCGLRLAGQEKQLDADGELRSKMRDACNKMKDALSETTEEANDIVTKPYIASIEALAATLPILGPRWGFLAKYHMLYNIKRLQQNGASRERTLGQVLQKLQDSSKTNPLRWLHTFVDFASSIVLLLSDESMDLRTAAAVAFDNSKLHQQLNPFQRSLLRKALTLLPSLRSGLAQRRDIDAVAYFAIASQWGDIAKESCKHVEGLLQVPLQRS